MKKQHVLSLFFSSIFLLHLLSEIQGARGSYDRHHKHGGISGFHPKKLFIFGDSYVDTGNSVKWSVCWKVPYGITFPGKPDGRFSDGLILIDRLAEYLGLVSPIPFVMRKHAPKLAKSGMNFAFGGTGVFNTLVTAPNMTVQIDYLQNLVNESFYTKTGLRSSLTYVSVSGNDYFAYKAKGGTAKGLPAFIARVVKQIAVNLKRIHDMGVRKVAVGALQPLGCLPQVTVLNNFTQCNETSNAAAKYHNILLKQAVAKLNNESKEPGAFIILDLFDAFTSVLNQTGATGKFEAPILKQCCIAKAGYSCSNVNAKGEKMYTVCDNPRKKIFWDTVHPTHAGWHAVFSALEAKF